MTKDEKFDAIAYLNKPRWKDSIYGLDRIRLLLKLLGNPQDALKFVHIAGTNGKGSNCAYLSNILMCAGYKTGIFTSPYVFNFEERIQIDGKSITPDELCSATLRVKDAASKVEREAGIHPTEFELMCAVALLHFSTCECDIVVLEVGLGGRYDATNVIKHPLVCIITRIGLDHTNLLGNSLENIAQEKAGIIKDGVSVVVQDSADEALDVIKGECEKKHCKCIFPDSVYIDRVVWSGANNAQPYRFFTYRNKTYKTKLVAKYMPQNAACAIEAAHELKKHGFNIHDSAIERGIEQTSWPARFQIVSVNPTIIIDAAHNPQGAYALTDALKDIYPNKKFIFVMSVMQDKDYKSMIRATHSLASAFIVFRANNSRALEPSELEKAIQAVSCAMCNNTHTPGSQHETGCKAVPVSCAQSAKEAISRAIAFSEKDDVIVVFGSLYSVADIMSAIKANNSAHPFVITTS